MKNKKLGFISLISVLSIGGIAFAAISTVNNYSLNEVEAQEGVPCTITLNATNAPTLVNGEGLGQVGSVQTSYTKAKSEAGFHVTLTSGGTITNSGLAWNGTLGGFTHGLRSVSVEFEKDKEKFPDPYDDSWQPSKIDISKVYVYAVYQDGKESSNSLSKSGTIKFNENNLPCGFRIALEPNSEYTGSTANLYAKIKSVTLSCDMIVRNRIEIVNNKHSYKVWKSNASHENLGNIGNLDYSNFPAGTTIGFTLDPEKGETMDISGITYEGGTLVEEAVPGQLCPNYYFTLGQGKGRIEIVKAGRPELYPGRSFLGKYTAATLSNYSIQEKSVELTSDGTLLWDDSKWTYTADENDNITIKEQPSTYQKQRREFKVISDDIVRLAIVATEGSAAPQYTYAYRGLVDEVTTTTITKKDNNPSDYIFQFKNGAKEATVFTYYRTSVVSGVNGVEITGLDNDDVTLATKFKITETLPTGSEFELERNFTPTFTVDGSNTTATIYAGIKSASSGISTIKPDGYEGTYTGESGALILNGFGQATLGTASATTYTLEGSKVTLETGEIFELDKTGYTYTLATVTVDPWATAPKTYRHNGSTSYDLTFDNGKVTVNLDGFDGVIVDYTIDGNLVKFSAKYNIENMLGSGTGTAHFEFTIGEGALTLTSTKTITADLFETQFDMEPIDTQTIITLGDIYE